MRPDLIRLIRLFRKSTVLNEGLRRGCIPCSGSQGIYPWDYEINELNELSIPKKAA